MRALIFDLDDTLYCERDFVSGGFLAAAHLLASRCGADADVIHEFMSGIFAAQGRRQVFPATLERFPGSGLLIADLVAAYRSHKPDISLFAGYAEILQKMRARFRLGLLTDGNPEVQRAKYHALRLGGFFDYVVFTWDFGAERQKPHPFPFRLMLDSLAVKPSEALFIGDNLEKDCLGARAVGMKSVRVRKPNQVPLKEERTDADFVIDSLTQLPFILTLFGGQHEAA